MLLKYLWSKFLKKIRGSAIRNSHFDNNSIYESGCHIINSSFGKYSYCGYDCTIINTQIGKFCSLSDNIIIGGARHPLEWVSTSSVFYSDKDSIRRKFSHFKRSLDRKTIIENDVWIGTNAIVIQGVRIGTGAVIGAGSIVTKDVMPYEVVAGNPARHIRYRFNQDIIDALLKSEWWDIPEDKLEQLSKKITNPVEFIKALEL